MCVSTVFSDLITVVGSLLRAPTDRKTALLRAPMEITGFSFRDYAQLLDQAKNAGYEFVTVAEYLSMETVPEPVIIVRHDVDRRVTNAVEMAQCEAQRDVQATYYFRTATFVPSAIHDIQALGHEVGYHYEDLVRARGDHEQAIDRFERNLDRFRELVPVETVAAHGNPLSSLDNCDIWKNSVSFEDFDLVGDASLSFEIPGDGDPVIPYFSETNRTWGDYGADMDSTAELISYISNRRVDRLYLLVHPERWSRTRLQLLYQCMWDLGANTAKKIADLAR